VGDRLAQICEEVVDEATFLVFVRALREDRRAADAGDPSTSAWQNHDIESFFESAEAWATETGFGRTQGDRADNPWRSFARFLWCGKIYE
jgi:hypothetical protein